MNERPQKRTDTHTLIPPWEDQCEWHRMTRMTGPDCAVMCNLINTHTHTHTHFPSACSQNGAARISPEKGLLLYNDATHSFPPLPTPIQQFRMTA